MATSAYEEIIEMIQNRTMDIALKTLFSKLSDQCLPLIRSKGKNLSQREVLAVFYYAFLDLCKSVNIKKSYSYLGDQAFISYFKTACVNQTHNFIREFASPEDIFPHEIIELMALEGQAKLRQSTEGFLTEKKRNYDFEPAIDDQDYMDYLGEVIRIYHLLNEKCKILILLKFFVKQTHEQISDCLRLLYEVNTADVSKTQLSRCIHEIRERIMLNSN